MSVAKTEFHPFIQFETILTVAETGQNQKTVQTTVVNGTLIANPDQIPSHAEPRT